MSARSVAFLVRVAEGRPLFEAHERAPGPDNLPQAQMVLCHDDAIELLRAMGLSTALPVTQSLGDILVKTATLGATRGHPMKDHASKLCFIANCGRGHPGAVVSAELQ
jgi:hypothetical protein